MDVQVNFKLLNPEFSQDYADEYQGGNESESNMKYLWAVMYELKNVRSVSLIDNESFSAEVNGNHWRIPETLIFRCNFEGGHFEDFAVSKSILNNFHEAKRSGYEILRFYFYINSHPESFRLTPNSVIDVNKIQDRFDSAFKS